MANAFDFATIAVLSLLSYARDTYGEELTLNELADSIDADGEDFFANNKAADQDQTLSMFAAKSLSSMLRELATNGYDFDDLLNGVTNVLPEEALNGIVGDDDDEESEEDDEEEDLDEEDEDDDEESDDDEEEDDLDEEDDEDDEESDDDEEEDDELDEEDEELDEEDDEDEEGENY